MDESHNIDPGRKLAASSILIFCTPEELRDWILMLCKEKRLGCASFTGTRRFAIVEETPNQITLKGELRRVFLFRKAFPPPEPLEMNNVQPHAWGLIDIQPGRLYEDGELRVLTYSEIHGVDFEHAPMYPAKLVKWLKRRLKDSRRCGIKWKGEEKPIYRNLCYSPGALYLYRTGVKWKQFPDSDWSLEPMESKDD